MNFPESFSISVVVPTVNGDLAKVLTVSQKTLAKINYANDYNNDSKKHGSDRTIFALYQQADSITGAPLKKGFGGALTKKQFEQILLDDYNSKLELSDVNGTYEPYNDVLTPFISRRLIETAINELEQYDESTDATDPNDKSYLLNETQFSEFKFRQLFFDKLNSKFTDWEQRYIWEWLKIDGYFENEKINVEDFGDMVTTLKKSLETIETAEEEILGKK
ncbi:hypothetical protein [Flavobacterium daemonense]|uniref:hypothetical protein n=1 Tax=Flavobacterium daemonense TaxID=1393049 RepID=UPI001186F09E|nr:hypothetical protein [Flavobacterium daemonense]KAF2337210.1 hypothetical protein FND99_02010 [Flavobacterium daemonense]